MTITEVLIDYLDYLTFDYTQLCQKDDRTVYGIPSGKKCRKGKPISFSPDDPKLRTKLKPSGKDHKEYIRAGEENNKEVLSKLRKLKEEYDAAEKIKDDFLNKRNNVSISEAKQAIVEQYKIIKEGSQMLEDMRSKYLDRGDKDKAEENTKNVMDATPTNSLPFRESVYRDTLYTLNRFTNNTVNTLSSLGYRDPRAETYPPSPVTGQSRINVGKPISTKKAESTLWHEFGHHVEFSNPDLAPAMKSWIQTRASGRLEKLSVLTGDSRYSNYEVAWAGNFGLGPYVGRDYESGTEVISMGLEEFSTPSRMFNFYLVDPEHFTLTLGVLDSL